MRDLPTGVLASPDILLGAYLELTDINSVTYVHSLNDLVSISELNWQIPFDGGMSKPTNYNLTLGINCLDTIKDLRTKYLRAETRLTMVVGSAANTIQLHVGRVRGIDILGDDPLQMRLNILDKLFDDNPAFPVETMLDSYSNNHPEDLAAAQPIYYGRHHRPFYHTATDCNLSTLLGPRNISNANHVNSIWFNSNLSLGNDTGEKHNLLMVNAWSTGTNQITTNSFGFIVSDIGSKDIRLFDYSDGVFFDDTVTPPVLSHEEGVITATTSIDGSIDTAFRPYVQPKFNFVRATRLSGHVKMDFNRNGNSLLFVSMATTDSDNPKAASFTRVLSYSNVGGSSFQGPFDSDGGFTNDIPLNNYTHFKQNRRSSVFFDVVSATQTLQTITAWTCAINFEAQLVSELYLKFSVFSPVINSADIALSANPIGIFDDVASNHVSFIYHQDQSSQTQVDVQSNELQMFLPEQTPAVDLIDDISRISDTYIWAADSGMLKIKSYQESATATNSANFTITLCDMYPDTFVLADAPLGTTVTGQDLYSSIRLGFDYDFQLGQFKQTVVADKNNNNLCNSMFNSGINKTLDIDTKYITDPDTASYYLGKLVRKKCQSTEFISFKGGPSLLNLELADVLKIQHPMIVGSEALYQVVKTKLDVINGQVGVTAAKLVEQG